MAVECITVCFPFKLQSTEFKSQYPTPVLRQEGTVAFTLPFNALINVSSEKSYTVSYTKKQKNDGTEAGFIYQIIIDFTSINDAIDFCSNPIIHVSYNEVSDLSSLDKKLEEASDLLEKTGQSWRKKRKAETDEDGYFTA
ncbi:hypothetical protein NEPAR06_1127 [Nematocida parisii]|uniref:Uncharacterized protein n=1 Tax=Nematocida parisii (strain ERTm3) TaxID=935791 RepID=I3EIL2_NEMP3|nr:uncharacterized protein NEPG_01728 [Nematocida parisii ERTm1]EIJ89059.1 hypothetical protein NEQG_00878 [Nematocida parisii ERTm3]KAI5125947.1 hypothetical protein NEPAR08_0283 [Nematocida parisii]EIJ93386.1 hypothetical protein NEPG_01728 [Nematocida parisii ERTm1]KAI5126212.1 hypothetical protein NEPAR03_0384 [Nematocida parisii]KAI5140457.1 hypothetical protein NEPAR04_0289 [Nematocida parisii]|eukprot:XP_013059556.1 hypothetical protein NEPG_01728 [Nematocida parisii ERTm1]